MGSPHPCRLLVVRRHSAVYGSICMLILGFGLHLTLERDLGLHCEGFLEFRNIIITLGRLLFLFFSYQESR